DLDFLIQVAVGALGGCDDGASVVLGLSKSRDELRLIYLDRRRLSFNVGVSPVTTLKFVGLPAIWFSSLFTQLQQTVKLFRSTVQGKQPFEHRWSGDGPTIAGCFPACQATCRCTHGLNDV